ncbi:MAG: NAD(P)H-dependent oxidoreductase subunit E, partial [Planctomycetes bacterium]|nr:NAD(P)H-dependent oxidoreductase subunit E [Planctomycetota bacterium]
KVVVVCRSISCECLGGTEVLQAIKDELGIEEHQSTPDGQYALTTEECLAGCDHAPCVLINEKLHKRVRAADVPKLLADADNDKLDGPRSDLYDAPTDSGNGQHQDRPPDASGDG